MYCFGSGGAHVLVGSNCEYVDCAAQTRRLCSYGISSMSPVGMRPPYARG